MSGEDNTAISFQQTSRHEEYRFEQRRVSAALFALLLAVIAQQALVYYYYPSYWGISLFLLFFLFARILLPPGMKGVDSRATLILFALCFMLAYWQATRVFVTKIEVGQAQDFFNSHGSRAELCLKLERQLAFGRGEALWYRARVDGLSGALLLKASLFRLQSKQAAAGTPLCGSFKLKQLHKGDRHPALSSFHGRLLRDGYVGYSELTRLGTYLRDGASGPELLKNFPELHAPALLYATVLGRKDLPSDSVWQLFQELGISHLLVISGYHIAVLLYLSRGLFGFLITPLLPFYSLLHRQRDTLYLSLLFVWLYYSILPNALPVERAAFASSLLLLRVHKARKLYPFRCIILIGLVLTVLHPGAFFEAGVQLSFSALCGLCSGAGLLETTSLAHLKGLSKRMCYLFALSGAASIATAPLILAYFDMLVPLSALNNSLLAPCWSLLLVFVGGLLLCVDSLCLRPLGLSLPRALWELYFSIVERCIHVCFWLRDRLHEWGLGAIYAESFAAEKTKYCILLGILALSMPALLSYRLWRTSKRF